MKRTILLLTLCFILSTSFSQNFLLPSSKWTYVNNGGLAPPNALKKTYEYVKDTTVMGKSAQLMSNGFIFHSRNDSVFYYDSLYMNFGLIYDYNASVGDTIESQVPSKLQHSQNTFRSVVMDIKYEIFPSGDSLRKFMLKSLSDTVHFKGGAYYERIGALEFLPVLQTTIPEHFVIKCYSDSTIDAQLAYLQYSCDSLVSGIDELSQEKISATIQPNPVEDQIALPKSSVGIVDSYAIYSSDGKIVSNGKVKYNQILGLDGLSPGMYLLRVHSETLEEVKVYRFVKK